MENDSNIKIIECPRDAIQGIQEFIPTKTKIEYINQLLKVGFDTIDFGSFVSPKAIPQLKDTAEVLAGLEIDSSTSKLLAIVANTRGAQDAANFEEIAYLGFPFSISETFQQRNTNSSIVEALNSVNEIQEICSKSNKQLVCYISMGFGNPYGDPYDVETVAKFAGILESMGVNIISLADTIGVSDKDNINYLYSSLINEFSSVEFGAHLHSSPNTAADKIKHAFNAGCRRFDGAIRGFGGCPMAKDDLVGNIATEVMLSFFKKKKSSLGLDQLAFDNSVMASASIFDKYH